MATSILIIKTVIDTSQASIAIISNGYMNTGGVPYTKVLRDLSKLDVYETGDRGTIIVTSDGSQLSIQTEKGNNQPSVKGKESDESYGYDRRCDKKERQGKFLYGFLCCSSGGICGGKSKQGKRNFR